MPTLSSRDELTTVADDDIFYVVDDSETSASAKGKKVKKSTLINSQPRLSSPEIQALPFTDALPIDIHNALNTSLVTYNGNQYAAYLDNQKPSHVILKKRAVGAKSWQTKDTGQTLADNSDAHDDVGMGIDENGIIHVAGMTHHEQLFYFRMPTPESIFGSAQVFNTMLGTNETATTYPIFFNNAAGELFYCFRDGQSGNGDHYLYKFSSGSWIAAPGTTAGKFTDGKTDSQNSYMGTPHVDLATNTAHFGFNWKDASGRNHTVGYVKYDMTSNTFTKSDGTTQTLPITEANMDVVDPVPISTGGTSFIQVKITDVMPDGNPAVVFSKNDSDGISQIWFTKSDGSVWSTPVQLTSGPAGSFTAMLLIDTTFGANGTIWVVYRTSQYGSAAIHVAESKDLGVTWSSYALADPGFGYINFKFSDFRHWYATKELYTCFTTFGYRGGNTYAKPLYMLRWLASEGGTKKIQSQRLFTTPDDFMFEGPNGSYNVQTAEVNIKMDGEQGTGLPFPGKVNHYFYRDTSSGPEYRFRRSRGHDANAQGIAGDILQDGDFVGHLTFQGHDGTYTDTVDPDYITAARITVEIDGTPAAGIMPGKMRLRTGDSSGTLQDRVAIDSNGDVEILGLGEGLIFQSPNGSRFRLTVDNSGVLGTTAL